MKAAVIDRFLYEGAEKKSSLAEGKAGGQGDSLLGDLWAGVLARGQAKLGPGDRSNSREHLASASVSA